MSIFTRFGEVKITARHGQQKAPYFKTAVELLSVRYVGEFGLPSEDFCWQDFLRADGGWKEIETAAAAAPLVTLSPADLKAAIKEAE